MSEIIGIDKFDGHYVKVLGDFNEVPFMVNFEYGRFQKIDDNYYWLLCYATQSLGITFRYKPTEQRLPCPIAVLIKKTEYSTSFKNKAGGYDKLTFKPSSLEAWLINYLNGNQSLLDGSMTVKGYVNFNQTLYDALRVSNGESGINPTSFMNLQKIEGKFDLPDCELKSQSSKSSLNSSNSNSSSLKPLDDKLAQDIYEEAIKLSSKVYSELSVKMSAEVDVQDLNNLRLGIYLELLKRKRS